MISPAQPPAALEAHGQARLIPVRAHSRRGGRNAAAAWRLDSEGAGVAGRLFACGHGLTTAV